MKRFLALCKSFEEKKQNKVQKRQVTGGRGDREEQKMMPLARSG